MTEQVGNLKITPGANGLYIIGTMECREKITVSASDLLYLMDFLLQIASKLEKEQKEESDYLPPIPDS